MMSPVMMAWQFLHSAASVIVSNSGQSGKVSRTTPRMLAGSGGCSDCDAATPFRPPPSCCSALPALTAAGEMPIGGENIPPPFGDMPGGVPPVDPPVDVIVTVPPAGNGGVGGVG